MCGCRQIEMVRDSKRQIVEMKVPEEHLNGHAFHTYHVVSPDGMCVHSPTLDLLLFSSSFSCFLKLVLLFLFRSWPHKSLLIFWRVLVFDGISLFSCRVNFEFQHNVCGRSIYAEGTVDAVLFLAKKVRSELCLI